MGLPVYETTSKTADKTSKSVGNETPSGAGTNSGAGTTRPKTKQEEEADRLYEEAMEEEYAKREGGA
jgi:hypothetical protein